MDVDNPSSGASSTDSEDDGESPQSELQHILHDDGKSKLCMHCRSPEEMGLIVSTSVIGGYL